MRYHTLSSFWNYEVAYGIVAITKVLSFLKYIADQRSRESKYQC